MSYQDAEQEAIKLSEDNLKLKAELSKIHYTEKQWICDSHQWPYGAESTCGPICPWCERLKVEKLEAELAKAKAEMGAWKHDALDARTQNARLEAALRFIHDECDWEELGNHTGDNRIGECSRDALSGHSTALHSLLGPTVEALECVKFILDECGIYTRKAEVSHIYPKWCFGDASERVDKELSRLRKVMGDKP